MIEINNLTKRYGALTALDGLTLSIKQGEVFGFIGPNGAGKSTAMKILACLLKPDGGSASVCGLDIAGDGDEIRRVIGYMPDFLGVYEDLTVDEYLQFFAAAFGIARARRRVLVSQVLELTDLTQKRDALVDSLSRGMQQRLGVARVLIHDPKVLLLDEPASGLDPRARIEMRELLQELARMGKTLMVSSHILSELGEMCNTIGIIERGKLLYAGSIQEAFEKTRAAAPAGERILIKLDAESARASVVAAAFAGEARVMRCAPDEGGSELLVELAPGEHGHHFLIERVIAAGGRIRSFQPAELKLEDAFLRLTTGALQ
jgi:ABC-2 type transport system ATP-binding protein